MQNVVKIRATDQETDFTAESKRLIEAKSKKQNNGIYSIIKKGGYGVSLKDESEMALAKIFTFLIFNFLNYMK